MFDLTSYLERIGAPEAGTADEETLAAVQLAHRMSIPFENIDVRLGRPVEIDSGSVFERLVTDRRGGYCFQQNQLFLDALLALGFNVRTLLARVWLGSTETPPQAHSLLLIEIGGTPWIADAGFGGSFAPPMPLVDGARTQEQDGAHFRLARDSLGWRLDRVVSAADLPAGEGATQTQYTFDLRQVFPADLELANHWTSTAPESIFRNHQFVNMVRPGGFASILDTQYKELAGGERAEEAIDGPASFRRRLCETFGLDLTQQEVDGLELF